MEETLKYSFKKIIFTSLITKYEYSYNQTIFIFHQIINKNIFI